MTGQNTRVTPNAGLTAAVYQIQPRTVAVRVMRSMTWLKEVLK